MSTVDELTLLRQESRRHQLHRQGFGHYHSLVAALDWMKEVICPRSRHPNIEPKRLLNAFLRLNQQLIVQAAPLRLAPQLSHDHRRISLTLTLESVELVDYFVDIDRDPCLQDPLGVRSLFGIFNYYGIRRLQLNTFCEGDIQGVVDTHQELYHRHFRFNNTSGAALRVLIDRALWGGERLILPPHMVHCFTAIDPQRYDFLSDIGLMIMESDDRQHYELFVPQPERQLKRLQQQRQLRQMAEAVNRRIDKEGRGFLLLARHSSSSRERRFFQAIEERQLLANVTFRQYLADLHLAVEPHFSEQGSLLSLHFYATDQRAHHHRPITESDFPPGLLRLIQEAQRSGKNQTIPHRRDYLTFLSRPEVVAYLRQRAISVVLPKHRRFEGLVTTESPYLYVENLIQPGAPASASTPPRIDPPVY